MIRTGIGFDAHRLVAGRPLVLGGVRIEHERGLQGHSDADVVCHALVDALFGAVAAGSIGEHFPDTDPRWKDADSVAFVRAAVTHIATLGARVVNVDVTVIAEAPKLAPHVEAMRERLAPALGLGVDAVSVKGTTVEGMGAFGRGEGIAAMAVATVRAEDRG